MAGIEKWREINLPELLYDLGEVSLQIQENQKSGIERKKSLVASTKEFKSRRRTELATIAEGSAPDVDAAADGEDVMGIMKCYQEEIDTINRRAKYSEAAFLKLYATLSEAPDPTTLVDPKKEEKIAQLTQEIKDMEEEFKTVKNQEVQVRTLQARVRELEGQREQGVYAEEQGAQFEQLFTDARKQIEQLQAQLLEEKQRYDDFNAAKEMEMRALNDEAERLSAELEDMREKADNAVRRVDSGLTRDALPLLQSRYDTLAIKLSVVEKSEALLKRKNEELEHAHKELTKVMKDSEAEIEELRQTLEEKRMETDELKHSLHDAPSKEEIDRLKKMVANVDIVDRTTMDEATTDLEARLLQRQQELMRCTEMQLQTIHDQKALNAQLHKQLEEARAEVLSERTKVHKMEERKMETHPSSLVSLGLEPVNAFKVGVLGEVHEGGGAAAVGGGASGYMDPGKIMPIPAGEGGGMYGSSISFVSYPPEEASARRSETSGTEHQAMPSMHDIVRHQLEQLKVHNRDLEQDRDAWKKACQSEKWRAEQVHQDNADLLQKLRYAQSYVEKPGAGAGSGSTSATKRAYITPEKFTDLEDRYRDRENADPLETFKSNERERRIQLMSQPERILVTTGHFLFSIKITRIATLIYLGTLHLSVCFSFLKMTSIRCPGGEMELP